MVAGSELVAARVEAMLRPEPRLRVAVSAPAELAQHLDDDDSAIIVLALPPPRLAATLEALSHRSRVGAVIVLSSDTRGVLTARARRAGVRAVLRSDATPEELAAAIVATRAGLVVLHPDALSRPPATLAESAKGETTALTPREVEILEMMAEGLSNRRLAAHLGISSHTVKFHVASILAKLGALSRTEAVTLGVRRGLISL